MDISRARILDLITYEKEVYSDYLRLCAHFDIIPDPIATSCHTAKISVLKSLLDGKMTQDSMNTMKNLED